MRFNEPRKENSGKGISIMKIIPFGVFLLLLFAYHLVVNNNEAGHYVMIEPLSGSGQLNPVMDPGRYFIWFNKPYNWDKSSTFWFSKEETEGSPEDDSVQVRYNDGGTAEVSGSVRYTIGMDKEKFIKLHILYRNQENFRDRAIRALVTEVLTLTSTLMSAEESYTFSKAQFTQWALDQLNNGVYLVDIYEDTVTLPTGEKKTVRKAQLKIDPVTKQIMRKEYALKDFDIKFSQFVITDPDYQKQILDQIDGKLKNLMGKVASQAEAELNAAKQATAIAEGQRNVVMSEFEQKVKNVGDIIGSEIEAAKQRIPAEARNVVSAIYKQAAEFQRDADTDCPRTKLIFSEIAKRLS